MRGLAAAMGLSAESHHICPRTLFAMLAPWGPADPRDLDRLRHACESGQPWNAGLPARLRGRSLEVPASPFPAIAFAAGRRTVPVLRALKAASPATFTIFLGNPRTARHGADAIWAPAHDGLAGPHVVSTPTTPHPYSTTALEALRENPDPRIAALPKPLCGVLIGGTSRHHRFDDTDRTALLDAVKTIRTRGFGIAATVSRRTPPAFADALRSGLSADPGAFLWKGEGDNPYASILACADALLVTADSTNMLSEAVATTAPVHVFEPSGGHLRLTRLLDGLIAAGRVRRWTGAMERWPVQPLDATMEVAADLTGRWRAFQQANR